MWLSDSALYRTGVHVYEALELCSQKENPDHAKKKTPKGTIIKASHTSVLFSVNIVRWCSDRGDQDQDPTVFKGALLGQMTPEGVERGRAREGEGERLQYHL